MSVLGQLYEDNPHWMALAEYAMDPPNDGYYKRWLSVGSVGMNEPMPLQSNEYYYTYMKHSQNSVMPYRGNLMNFSPSVTTNLKNQVRQCSFDTINPIGCSSLAVNKVYTMDSTPHRKYESLKDHPGVHRFAPDITPHPYEASYKTGFPPTWVYVPPNSPYQH